MLAGCAEPYAEMAGRAKSGLVGLSETDIRMCAGHPAAIDGYKGGEIMMYERDAIPPGGISPPATPLPWGIEVAEPPVGYCRVQLRLEGGKVTEVSYAGQTDIWGAHDAACAPIVKNCMGYQGKRN
jgi:hypothetical protein